MAARFQIRADDAAAAALLALCWHWGAPEEALVAAVHYGGDTDTIAAIVGGWTVLVGWGRVGWEGAVPRVDAGPYRALGQAAAFGACLRVCTLARCG